MELTSLFYPDALLAILTLTFLEIILGIDNIVFISIVTGKLPQRDRPKTRNIGLILAFFFRVLMLLGLTWILKLNKPFWHIQNDLFSAAISGQSIIITAGGLFLLYKSVSEIHEKLEGDEEHASGAKAKSIWSSIIQIALLNLVFSFDSILTAIGLVSLDAPPKGFGYELGIEIMIVSVLISIVIMMSFAGKVSDFVNKNPTIQILGLSFLILIGVMLLAEGSHMAEVKILNSIEVTNIPKGYLYFTISFSLFIEGINMKFRKGKKPVHLHDSTIEDNELK